MPTIDIKKPVVEKLEIPEKGQVDYFDRNLKGFLLRVSPVSKVYYAMARSNGKLVRVKIGSHGRFTPETARKEAIQILAGMQKGINPNIEKKVDEAKAITLREVLASYLKVRDLKATTRTSYEYTVTLYLADWLDRPLLSITKDQVEKKHRQITEEHGPTPANYAFRILRALFSYAEAKYEDAKGNPLIAVNPVKRLSQVRAWNRTNTRRDQFIRSEDLPAWWRSVQGLQNETARDYLTLLLLTGLRRQEGARLRWADINFKARTLTIPDPKNRHPHTLPLSDILLSLLERRKMGTDSLFVFPGGGAGGYIVEPKRALNTIRKESGVSFTIHDIRRTFTTIAEQIVPVYTLKRLMNHATGGDVTAHHYVGTDEGTLRKHMQAVSDRIMELAHPKLAQRHSHEQ